MSDRELKRYLRDSLGRGADSKPEKKAETVACCTEVMRRYGDFREKENGLLAVSVGRLSV